MKAKTRLLLTLVLCLPLLTLHPTRTARIVSAKAQPGESAWRDEFESPSLQPRWSWLREDPTHWSLTARPGFLRVITQTGGVFATRNNQKNLLLTPAPTGDFRITTKVSISPSESYQFAALQVYQDDDNYVQVNRSYAGGSVVSFDLELGGVVTNTNVAVSATTLYLRICREGTTYAGYFSTDGFNWSPVGQYTAVLLAPKVGLGAANNLADVPEIPADFDFLQVEPAVTRVLLPVIMKSFTALRQTPVQQPSPTGSPTATPMPGTTPTPSPSADIIFRNGTVLTMQGSAWEAEALAIRGEKILAVSGDAEIQALLGPGTVVVDLHGCTLMPGFVDPHTHIFNSARGSGLSLEEAQQIALENGITTLANMYNTQEFLSEMQEFHQSGRLRVRTSLYLNYTTNCGEVLGDWYRQHPPTHVPGEMLRIGGVKLFTDGGSCGCPAYSYDDPRCGYGDLWFSQEEMNTIVAGIHASGYQASIHALGDRAAEQALNAIEFALIGQPNAARHRIEHNSLVRDDMVPRYSQVAPVALIFGAYPACKATTNPPPEAYQHWEWRWRDLIAANPNVHFAWHSDSGSDLFPVAPLHHLYSMVTPFEVDGDGVTICSTPEWLTQKMLTVEQVLPMMTTEAAYALFRDDEVGSLAPGKFADLIILSDNPLSVPPEAIKDIEVWMTMVGGRVEHCAPNHETMCPGGGLALLRSDLP